jgi:hypothetical protein
MSTLGLIRDARHDLDRHGLHSPLPLRALYLTIAAIESLAREVEEIRGTWPAHLKDTAAVVNPVPAPPGSPLEKIARLERKLAELCGRAERAEKEHAEFLRTHNFDAFEALKVRTSQAERKVTDAEARAIEYAQRTDAAVELARLRETYQAEVRATSEAERRVKIQTETIERLQRELAVASGKKLEGLFSFDASPDRNLPPNTRRALVYTVGAGESLRSIAQRLPVGCERSASGLLLDGWERIARLNRLDMDPAHATAFIPPGIVLIIPEP